MKIIAKIILAVLRAVFRITYRSDTLRPPVARKQFLAQIPRMVDTLEIGPFDTPELTHAKTFYFDVLDREGLRKRAVEHARNPDGCPKIHYVSPNGDLAIVDKQFACVFSSHVIEHQTDLVGHFNAVARILEPGSHYYMIIPDKRFCFDHYRLETTSDGLERAHREARSLHAPEAVLEALRYVTHNNAGRHWLGFHGKFLSQVDPRFRQQMASEQGRAERGEYVDIHAWAFTPTGFYNAVSALHKKGVMMLEPMIVYDTMFGEQEFFAVLRKPVEA